MAAVAVALIFSATAWAQDAGAIKAGMAVYRDIANCGICHGWDGSGVPFDSQGFVGANLALAGTDRKALVEVIRCGRPFTRMPRYSREAWTDEAKCFGMTEDDLAEAATGPPDRPERHGAWLSDEQIELVAGFVIAFYIGKDMTPEKCEMYNGAGSPACENFRD